MPLDTTVPSTIPILDIGGFLAGDPAAAEATAAELRRINETVGFLFITGHGVPRALVDETFAAAARFHAQPEEAKLAVKVNAAMQGYLPLRGSTTRSSPLSPARHPNENEAFFVKRTAEDDTNDGRWPADLPGFRETALRYYDAMDGLAQALLPLYALALGLPRDHFGPLCDRPLTSLRLSHYPACDYGADQFGIAPHTDSSFITLLAQNEVSGLQIRTTGGQWIEAPVVPDSFVVNTGDMLHRWTNGRFLSTPHRAFNTSGGSRYAIPYFFHPNPDTMLECLPGCAAPGEAPRFEPMTAGGYMAWFRGQNYDHLRKGKDAS
jgi:isopenicillin N synthase-like dioxygenase